MTKEDDKIKLPETLEQKALAAAEEAKKVLPPKPWGGRYWDNDKKEWIQNPAEVLSDNPRYWSKGDSCKICYGRGIEGNITFIYAKTNKLTTLSICPCSRKAYGKWRDEYTKQWMLDNKDKAVDTVETVKTIDKSDELLENRNEV